ncbi:MAG: 30S ribosomal protein S20 [Pseudomonadota bacterium]
MANTSSAKKAARQTIRRTEINKARRTRLRTEVRRVEEAIATGDPVRASEAFKIAQPVIARSGQLGVVHANTASRKVARLAKRIRQMAETA